MPYHVLGPLLLVLAVLCLVLPFASNIFNQAKLIKLQFAAVLLAFISLTAAFIEISPNLILVVNHTSEQMPLLWRIVGVWSNHEGSMLLITLIISGYLYWFNVWAASNMKIPTNVVAVANNVGAISLVMLLGYVLLYCNPFLLNPETTGTLQGMGLNPQLEDMALAYHPPILYLGYFGLIMPFVIAQGVIRSGVYNNWQQHLLFWLELALMFLTLGITAGSWWAYRELGWGGFWFWDPVENVALMPWLAAIVLQHLLIVTKHHKQFISATLIMAIVAFLVSWFGSFIVRSGLISSVHAFAENSDRAIPLLLSLGVLMVISVVNFTKAKFNVAGERAVSIVSRGGAMIAGQILLVTFLITLAIGTIYPSVIYALVGQQLSVGPPYYNFFVNLMVLPLLMLMIVAGVRSWAKVKWQLTKPLIIAIMVIIVAVVMLVAFKQLTLSLLAIAVAVILLLQVIFVRRGTNYLAYQLGHAGLGLLVIGVVVISNYAHDHDIVMQPGEQFKAHNLVLTLDAVKYNNEGRYFSRIANFTLANSSNKKVELKPELRFYLRQNHFSTKPSIYHHILYDYYITIGELRNADQPKALIETPQLAVRIYYRPGIMLIWLGGVLMAMGSAAGVLRSTISWRKL